VTEEKVKNLEEKVMKLEVIEVVEEEWGMMEEKKVFGLEMMKIQSFCAAFFN